MTLNKSVFILIPVHNRKTITLACLEALEKNSDLERYQVVVIDDGSTDGTGQAIGLPIQM
jgi:glycosyltransferase involved in cell wall biosynthesis